MDYHACKYVNTNVSANSIELLELLKTIDEFNSMHTLFNLVNKINKKIAIIKLLKQCGFAVMNYNNVLSKIILDRLKTIRSVEDCITNNDDLSKLLDSILYNAYEYSGYQVLISNVPEFGISSVDNMHSKIDCESIYDTLTNFADGIVNVINIYKDSYLVQIADSANAHLICTTLHNKMIADNMIQVEYIATQSNNSIADNNTNNILDRLDSIDRLDSVDENIKNIKKSNMGVNVIHKLVNIVISICKSLMKFIFPQVSNTIHLDTISRKQI